MSQFENRVQELENQLETVSGDNLLLVREVLALHAGYEVRLSAVAAAGINMAGAVQGLPAGVELDRPKGFSGTMDGDTVRALIFSVERYFQLVGMVEAN